MRSATCQLTVAALGVLFGAAVLCASTATGPALALTPQEKAEVEQIIQRYNDPHNRGIQNAMGWTLDHGGGPKGIIVAFYNARRSYPADGGTAIAAMGGPKAIKDRFAQMLESDSPYDRGFSALQLGLIGDAAYADRIADLLSDEPRPAERFPEGFDKSRAAMALGLLNARKYRQKLVQMLGNDDRSASGAVLGLAYMNATDTANDIAKTLSNSRTQIDALYALAELGARQHADSIAIFLDPARAHDTDTEGVAAYALAKLGAADQAGKLADHLNDEFHGGDMAIALALLRCRQHAPQIAELCRSKSSLTRRDAALALGILAAIDRVDDVAALLNDEETFVRDGAAVGLLLIDARQYAPQVVVFGKAPTFDLYDLKRFMPGAALPLEKLMHQRFAEWKRLVPATAPTTRPGRQLTAEERQEAQRMFRRFADRRHERIRDEMGNDLIHSSQHVRRQCLDFIIQFHTAVAANPADDGRALAALGGPKAIKERFSKLLGSDSSRTRGFAAIELGLIGDPAYAPAIADLTTGEKPDVEELETGTDRYRAAIALAMLAPEQYKPRLVQLLEKPDGPAAAGAARALALINATDSSGQIARMLSTTRHVRCLEDGLLALGDLNAKEHVPTIAAFLDRTTGLYVPIFARQALAALRAKDYVGQIADCLDDYDPLAAADAALALAAMGRKEYAPYIIPLCQSPDPAVRRRAAIAIGVLGTGKAAVLGELLKDGDESVREAAAAGLLLMDAGQYAPRILSLGRAPRIDPLDWNANLADEPNAYQKLVDQRFSDWKRVNAP